MMPGFPWWLGVVAPKLLPTCRFVPAPLPSCDFAWPTAKATVRSRTRRLALTRTATNQRRSCDKAHLRAPARPGRGRDPGDLDFRSGFLLGVRVEIGAERANDCAGRSRACRSLRVDRKTRHERTHHAGIFALEHDRIVHRHHSTPASLRMRFPRRPASCPCTVTQTSLPLFG